MVAYGQFVRGDLNLAIATGQRAVAAAERLGVATNGLPERAVANAHYYRGSPDESETWTDRMVAAARTSGVPGRVAHALYMHSVGLTSRGDLKLGAAAAVEALDAAQASGSPTALAQAAYAAAIASEQARPDQALAQLRLSEAYANQVGNRWVRAFALTEIHWLQVRQGRMIGALAGYLEVIDIWNRGGDWAQQWLTLRHVVGLFATLRRDRPAVVLHGALHAAGATTAMPFEPHDVELLERTLSDLQARLGPDVYNEAFAYGRDLGNRQIVDFALTEIREIIASGTT